jgi:hypothetical protein
MITSIVFMKLASGFNADLYFLAFGADMGTALPDDDPLNGRSTAWAGKARAAEDLQLLFVAPSMSGH